MLAIVAENLKLILLFFMVVMIITLSWLGNERWMTASRSTRRRRNAARIGIVRNTCADGPMLEKAIVPASQVMRNGRMIFFLDPATSRVLGDTCHPRELRAFA